MQAVDLIQQREFANDASILREILNVTNMTSKTGNLISFLPLHIGLKVKITKKLLPPELVPECPCEVIGSQMHPTMSASAVLVMLLDSKYLILAILVGLLAMFGWTIFLH